MSEKSNDLPLSRRERRAEEKKIRKAVKKSNRNNFDPDRREFLKDAAKIIMPGGWIPDAGRKGIKNLPTPAKISLVKDAVLLSGLFRTAVFTESADNRSTKDRIESFSAEDAKNPERLREFAKFLADTFLELSKTQRLDANSMTSREKLIFIDNNEDFKKAVEEFNPNHNHNPDERGFVDYATEVVLIDMEELNELAQNHTFPMGNILASTLFHEWEHLDIDSRFSGELLNNPNLTFSLPNGNSDIWRQYRGIEVIADKSRGFSRAEEAIVDTIMIRRMTEQLGIGEIIAGSAYWEGGVDFLPQYTREIGLSLDSLNQMHASSDFEGLAKIMGRDLVGNPDTLARGLDFFVAINSADVDYLDTVGAYKIAQGTE